MSRSGGQAVTRAGAAARTWSWSSFTTKSAPGAWTSWRDTGKAPPALRTCLVPWALQNLPVPPHPCSPELPRGGGAQAPVPLASETYQDGGLLSVTQATSRKGHSHRPVPHSCLQGNNVCRSTGARHPALQPQAGAGTPDPPTGGLGGREQLALAPLSSWAESGAVTPLPGQRR